MGVVNAPVSKGEDSKRRAVQLWHLPLKHPQNATLPMFIGYTNFHCMPLPWLETVRSPGVSVYPPAPSISRRESTRRISNASVEGVIAVGPYQSFSVPDRPLRELIVIVLRKCL